MRYAGDLASLFANNMSAPEIKQPAKPGVDSDKVDDAIWKEELKDYVKQTGY
jgi:hypothetical protein